jgi:hypothetical protein
MNEYFTPRNECPCCGSWDGNELCRTPYCTDPLREYLASFYSQQGGVEFEYLRHQDYVLLECVDCGLIYQHEIPNDFLMRKLYEEWIDPQKCFELFERSRGIEYFAKLSSEIVGIAARFDRPPMELRFLDYSMGWGHWCRIAQSFGCTVHGTEFSQARIDYARSRGVTVIDYSEIPHQEYDFINIEQVFEHLPELRTTLTYLKSSLKPSGILKISVPNGWDVKRRVATWNWSAPKGSPDSLNPVAPLEHINCFNHSSLLVLAKGSGLVPADSDGEGAGCRPPRRLDEAVKAILRPYWRRMKGISSQPAVKGTYMFLRHDTP